MMWRLTPHIHSWADLSKNYNITFNVRQYGSFWVLVWPHTHHLVVIVQSLSRVQLFVTPWTAARQATLSFTISWSLLKLMSVDWVSEAIQPSHPLLPPSSPALNLSQYQLKLNGSMKNLQDLLEHHQKRCPFHHRGVECKSRKSRDTWSNRQVWPWSTKWSRAEANRVLSREHTGHTKHLLPTT